jgi:hypothetical protein
MKLKEKMIEFLCKAGAKCFLSRCWTVNCFTAVKYFIWMPDAYFVFTYIYCAKYSITMQEVVLGVFSLEKCSYFSFFCIYKTNQVWILDLFSNIFFLLYKCPLKTVALAFRALLRSIFLFTVQHILQACLSTYLRGNLYYFTCELDSHKVNS